jgi:hypothetical protein
MTYKQIVILMVMVILAYGLLLSALPRPEPSLIAVEIPMWNLIAILLGVVLRTQLPYLREAFSRISKTGSWLSWPAYKPPYAAAFAIALLGYGVSLVTVTGAWAYLMRMSFVEATALSYAGGALALDAIQIFGGSGGGSGGVQLPSTSSSP